MANEIQAAYNVRGATVYAEVRNSIGQPYSTVSGLFAAFSAGSFGNYAISLAEQGSSGLYAGNMPSVAAGVYSILARVRVGGSPAQSDTIVGSGSLTWTGTAVLSPSDADARTLLALPSVAPASAGGLLTIGTGSGQVNPSSGKVPATLAASDTSGNFPSNVVQIAGQTATAAGPVAFPASVGNSTMTPTQVKAQADQALAAVGLTSTITGRIDVAVSSRLAVANYTPPLDAAGVRDAVGLASANLDTQLAALPTAGENATAVRSELTTELGRLDVAVSSRASQTSLDTVDGIVDDILADTGEIGTAGAGLAAIPWNSAWDAEVQSECLDAITTFGPPTNTQMEARTLVSADYATAAALATVDTVVDAVQVVTDRLDTTLELDGIVYRFTANSLELAPTDGSAPTAAAIRAEIDANSTRLIAIEADTNELQGDWVNGGRLDLILDARASQASVDAIKASTDNLPPDPADASVINSALTSIGSALTLINGKVDTVKGKTDNLPASPAAVGSAMTLESGERSSVAAAVWANAGRTLTSFDFAVDISGDSSDAIVDATAAATAETITSDHGAGSYVRNTEPASAGTIASQVRTELATELARLDVAVGTRSTLAAGAAMVLTPDERTATADAILSRSVSSVETTAPEHSLTTLVLAALESSVAGETWTIKGTDGTTTRLTKTVTVDPDAEPITGVS